MASHTLLILGDSLSAAYGLAFGQGWVHLLKERLKNRPWQVVNASISGDTTGGGRARLPGLLASHRPDLVLIQLGANDYLRRLGAERMQENLDAMIRACRESGAEVVLVGLHPPLVVRLLARKLWYDAAPYLDAYRALVGVHRVAHVPCLLKGVLSRPALFQSDRMHPNAHAQPIILENIWRALRQRLEG